MSLALGVGDLEEIACRIESLVKLPGNMPAGLMGKAALLPGLAQIGRNTAPKIVSGGAPCQEVVKLGPDASLDELPILKCWPLDGGRFITLPLVFTREAATGKRNVGMYRMQVFDKNTTGMHWQRHKVGSRHHAEYEARGEDIPVPSRWAATRPLPMRPPHLCPTTLTRWPLPVLSAKNRSSWLSAKRFPWRCPPTPSS
jgi:4-hydroxy-3-polyprenylbenzoate decarboxylase